MDGKQAYAGLLERLVDPHFMNDADYMRSPESISETVKLMREERSEAAEAISSLLNALERIADRAATLRKGTDDWFELVEIEQVARAALSGEKL